jgi:hypothetical protein
MRKLTVSAAAALTSVVLLIAFTPAGEAVADAVKSVEVVNNPSVQASQVGRWTVGVEGPVELGNTGSNPLLIRDVEHPTRQAFYTELQCELNDGAATCRHPFEVQPPRGKRLLIRTICITAAVPVGQVVLTFIHFRLDDSPTPVHPLTVSRQGTFGDRDLFVGTHLVEISADGGEPLEVGVTRSGTAGNGFGRMAVSGYLVDCGPGPGCPVP